jgi:hypothetical protein
LTETGKTAQVFFPAGSDEVVPAFLIPLGDEFGPQFLDGFDIARIEQVDAAGDVEDG